MQPFVDIGLVKPITAPTLERIIDPYAAPIGPSCAWLAYEIASLDAVLGPDDSVRNDQQAAILSMESVQTAAENAVRSAGNGVLPARSIVRRVSGAEAAQDRQNASVDRGRLRRAYLVGILRSRDCNSDWSPQSAP